MQRLPESGKAKLVLKLAKKPILGFGPEYPPPEIKTWPDLGTLSFDYYKTPPPPKIEI